MSVLSITTIMIAFAHIPKTAGITVNKLLRRSFGLHHCDVEVWTRRDYVGVYYSAQDHRKTLRLYQKLRSIAGHQIKPHSDLKTHFPGVRYFTFLRDPITRTASHYQYTVQRMGEEAPFEKWITRDEFHNMQTKHIAGCDDLGLAIKILNEECFFVGLIENFDESLVMLQKKVDDDRFDIRYVRENVAPSSAIKKGLLGDPATRGLLEEVNQTDQQLYDYVRRELYPKQKDEIGETLASEVESFRSSNTLPTVNLNAMANLIKRNLLYKPLLRYSQRLGP